MRERLSVYVLLIRADFVLLTRAYPRSLDESVKLVLEKKERKDRRQQGPLMPGLGQTLSCTAY